MKDANTFQLQSYFSTQPVELVYLMGSRAKGEEKSYSDYDFGIFFNENLNDQARFDLKIKIQSELGSLLKTDAVDIVDLQKAHPFLKFEAIKNRGEVFVKNELKRVEFEINVLSEYFDRQYYIKRHVHQGLDRLKKEYGITTG